MFFFTKIIQNLLNIFNLKITNDLDYPIEANNKIKELINISHEFSMTSKRKMYMLSEAVRHVKNKKLDGDFVECGVWKGGNILLYKLLNDYYFLQKSIFAYDTFDGMFNAEDIDINYKKKIAKKLLKNSKKDEKITNIHCFATIENVKKNISKYTNLNNINFISGPVEKTLILEKNLPKKISILRLDTDFYQSTKIELDILFPRLVYGGILIIDDYGYWMGQKKAIDEYFNNKQWLHRVDQSCRYIIKD